MRSRVKYIAGRVLIPLTKWYLRKKRKYSYDGVSIIVQPGVFHPGLFPSTRFLIRYLKEKVKPGEEILELGCGTGLISVYFAKAGANVTACDLSQQAIANTLENIRINKVGATVIHSDLFSNIPKEKFDWIVINPPYYARRANTEEELAWNCGESFEYFEKLFIQLPRYTQSGSRVVMVLTEGCDIASIESLASSAGLRFQKASQQDVLFDGRDYIFEIRKASVSQAG